ncbi:MAG: Holliday junction branch migration protein RuvA [Nitrospirae bacterium]|nr:MAG: Holliday junction branch migration protein RuvA [Nitrospirota bacterium]
MSMIATVRGKVLKRYASSIIVEVSGVGYEVMVPLRSLSDIPEEGGTVFLYTHTLVKDDSIQLYGFTTEEERKLFRKLIGLTGIGPKLALNILSGMGPEELYSAIEKEDISMLTSLPGVGKKTAQRLLFEMKQVIPESREAPFSQAQYEDLLYALLSLGYTKSQAQDALRKVYTDTKPIEELLKEALQILSPTKDKLK